MRTNPSNARVGVGDAVIAADAPVESESTPESEQPTTAQPDTAPASESPVAQPPEDEPTEEEVGQLLPEAEAEEARQRAEREKFLASPAAVAERLASEFAYTDISGVQAEEILKNRFAPQLQSIDSDPSRILADVGLKRIESPTEALVETEGETMLLESEVPIRAPEEKGEMKKVDLGLEETEGGYSPANPIVDLTLPKTAPGSIAIGDKGLTITPEGMNPDSTAQRFGREDLFLPEAAEDTGLLLSPITGGVEISTMLLSRKSPEQLAFSVTLPEGAALRADESGGAEVVSEKDQSLAAIHAPRAVDAQGTPVPVVLGVKGNAIVLEVPHRSMDIAYPILVDPEIEENWWEFSDTSKLNYWTWSWNGVGSEDFIGQRGCIVTCWGNGLYVRSRSNFFYPGGSWGRWWFSPQGSTTYMHRVVLGPIHLDAHGCTANEPHPYVGVWNNGGFWSVLANAYPSGWGTWVDSGGGNLGAGTRTAFVGIEAAANTNIKCGRDYNLGGATLFLDDPENPSVGAGGIPTGWIGNGATFTASVTGTDPGLGIRRMTLHPQGQKTYEDNVGCNGHYSSQCPGSRGWSLGLGAGSLDQGLRTIEVSSEDALGKYSNTYTTQTKVDREKPEVDLEGQFAEATKREGIEPPAQEAGDDELSFPTYNLEIKATDGTAGNPALERSGVKSIEVTLDGKNILKEPITNPSPCDNCGKTAVVPVPLTELSPEAEHTLNVVVKDQVGEVRERPITFEYIPATGMKDEYVMQHFPLPDGLDHEGEVVNHGPEIAVNLMNGNLVYHQRDVNVEGPNVDLEVERFYNSQLPTVENTEWGDGWTLAQTPAMKPVDTGGSPAPDEAKLLETSGAVKGEVPLPTESGQTQFNPELQAAITKEADGGYGITDESGGSDATIGFDSAGQAQEMQTAGPAKVEYGYEAGDLSEIAVDDPTSSSEPPPTPPELPGPGPIAYESAFGTYGSSPGQMRYPADIARDAKGTLWVADLSLNRITHYSESGEYLGQFGTSGSGNGQLSCPSGIAIDAKGNFFVLEKCNNRVSEFNEKGEFIRKFGSYGSGPGQLYEPEGIAVAPDGKVWIADTYHGRLEVFSETGEFIKAVGSLGIGPGQFTEACGLDFGPGGHLWVADWSNNRVTELDENGNYVSQFGTKGSGDGQLERPFAVDVDSSGVIWVSDTGNSRIEAFGQNGEFIRKFGSKGSGPGQFNIGFPGGIASDPSGQLWIADTYNNRIQRWITPTHEIEEELIEVAEEPNDPALEVNVTSGLVSSVEGEGAGKTTYAYSGDDLVTTKGPGGETKFETEAGERIKGIELPNGTKATIKYEPTYHRVSSVTVDPAGAEPAKTTYFEYSNVPRRTVVTPPSSPVVTYDFAADGSLFRWWNVSKPPEIESLAGSLYEKRETPTAIEAGLHNLEVIAHSEEGISSVEILAGDNTLVEEAHCEQDPSKSGIECRKVPAEWVVETANLTPGLLQVEVIVIDRFGGAISKRFWVNIPYTPPPSEEEEERPTFGEIKSFRQNFGLDRDLNPITEVQQVNDRIFDLIGAWNNPLTPAGEVARSSAERWGVPLRPTDVAEMEYREWYVEVDGPLIDDWGYTNYPSTYAGYQIDNAAGGMIHIGFTQSQEARVAAFVQQIHPPASDRITAFTAVPSQSRVSLEAQEPEIVNAMDTDPQLSSIVTEVSIADTANRITVGSSDVAAAEQRLTQLFGSLAGISVIYQPDFGELQSASARDRQAGRMLAGDKLWTDWLPGSSELIYTSATAGFGAFEDTFILPEKRTVRSEYLLSAGHAGTIGADMYRTAHPQADLRKYGARIGTVERDPLKAGSQRIDALAIRFNGNGLVPHHIFGKEGRRPAVHREGVAARGQTLCVSGAWSERVKCGPVVGIKYHNYHDPEVPKSIGLLVVAGLQTTQGDSGAPVWNRRTGAAIGLLSGGFKHGAARFVQPLLNTPTGRGTHITGALNASQMGDLHIAGEG